MKNKIKKMIPNIITFSRLVSLLLGLLFFIKGDFAVSIILYVYGALSDALDGYFARRLNAYSKFGQYLDAVCDKLYSFSIVILAIIYGNYLVIVIVLLELVISIINLMIVKKRKIVYTERVGKIKTVITFPMMIVALLGTLIKVFRYVFIPLFILGLYFEGQSICAYINQLNGKSKEKIVDLKGMKVKEKVKVLFDEFKYYLFNPVTIIK